jgi:hypothetical protein
MAQKPNQETDRQQTGRLGVSTDRAAWGSKGGHEIINPDNIPLSVCNRRDRFVFLHLSVFSSESIDLPIFKGYFQGSAAFTPRGVCGIPSNKLWTIKEA